ncbi:hypothetical protein [Paracoccus benzoatiresistens]|uniref:Uncharacterized protein n=1 Tax=Paracoccus benzoatiresistens TaxID=2997341 RepID=A0ABT4JBS1_9RHOB|nr:hypothetical protein [Paracoccus sp. EF6]MCZ0964575.1 hypothetical protein [Paracoccus sp. EF6]
MLKKRQPCCNRNAASGKAVWRRTIRLPFCLLVRKHEQVAMCVDAARILCLERVLQCNSEKEHTYRKVIANSNAALARPT